MFNWNECHDEDLSPFGNGDSPIYASVGGWVVTCDRGLWRAELVCRGETYIKQHDFVSAEEARIRLDNVVLLPSWLIAIGAHRSVMECMELSTEG